LAPSLKDKQKVIEILKRNTILYEGLLMKSTFLPINSRVQMSEEKRKITTT